MQRKCFFRNLAVLLILLCSLLVVLPNSPALAHEVRVVAIPTPTPDANSILAKANDADSQAQSLLNVINTAVAVLGLFLALLSLAAGALTFFGFSSLKDLRSLRDQLRQSLADVQKDATNTRTGLLYLGLGDHLLSQGNKAEARANYRKAGSLLPKDAQIQYILGRIYSGDGYYEDAITSFEAATSSKPDYAEAYKELGLTYRRRGEAIKDSKDYDKAIEYLKRSVSLNPNDDDAHAILGGLYRRMGEYQQALASYEHAYRLNRFSSYALANMASLCWYLGMLDKARQYFILSEAAAAVRILEGQVEGYWDYYDRGLAQLVVGKIPEAKQSYNVGIKYTPGKVQFDSVLNNLYLLQKATDPIPGLDEIIKMVEYAKTSST